MIRALSIGLILLLFGLKVSAAPEATEVLQKAKALYKKEKPMPAIEYLKKSDHSAWTPTQVALKHFVMATWAQEAAMWKESQEWLNISYGLDKAKAPYIHYLLGQIYLRQGENGKAREQFSKGLALHPPHNIKLQMRFDLSEIAIQDKQYKTAYNQLIYLERKWRNTPLHGDVLWRLIKVENSLKRKWRACRWARKLYAQYPSHPLVFDWGIDLQSSIFEGKKLDCLASPSDQRTRIRRLQWAGESDRARKEIDTLRERATGSSVYDVDLLLVQYLTHEGFVEEAIKVLLKHYEKQKNSFAYLVNLGNAAARAGEYQSAVGAFYRAHKLGSRSKAGRQALFQAAFLSYQFQDYDGAARKFEQFKKMYPTSGLSRDSEWHLAWIRYLKGDYEGAIQSFKNMLNQRQRRSRGWAKYPADKIKYWLAMSYLRQEKHEIARSLFQELMNDRLLGYYSFVAQNRFNSIPGVTPVRSLAAGDRLPAEALPGLDKIEPPGAVLPQGQPAEVSEEGESEDSLNITSTPEEASEESSASGDGAGATTAAETPEESPTVVDDDDEPSVTAFTDPKLAKRFQQANDFMLAGLGEWARWELYEIERRTRNQDYLKMLMKAYDGIQSYNRSSYLSEVYFANQRKEHGLMGVRYLWEYAYPRAFHDIVEKAANQFGVPAEFVWSIMRAESQFKPDVVSPVGARGLMQLMPNTARQVARLMNDSTYQERQLNDPEINIRIGTRYLHRLLKKFDNQVALAAAAYNAGPHRAETWLSTFGNLDMDEFIEHIPFIETRNYVKKVVRHFGIYRDLYGKNQPPLAWLSQPIPIKVSARPSTRETWEITE